MPSLRLAAPTLLLLLLLLRLAPPVVCSRLPSCSPSPLSPPDDLVLDAFLLTSGQQLQLSCRLCSVCFSADSAGCSDPTRQLWMTAKEMAKARISRDNEFDSSWSEEVDSFEDAASRVKSLAANAKAAAARASQRLKLATSTVVHRFDRLRQLADRSESGVGLFKELRSRTGVDAAIAWFREAADGSVTRVEHEKEGLALAFDSLMIRRATDANTGVFTCQHGGRVRAKFVVTVAAGGTEPFREFAPPQRSLRPKLLPKANLKVFTRWNFGVSGRQVLEAALPIGGTEGRDGTIAVKNITWQVGICYVKQLQADKTTKPETSSLLKQMPRGLPCRSHLLPVSMKSLRSAILRPSEIRRLSVTGRVPIASLNFGGGHSERSDTLPQVDTEMMIVRRSFDIVKEGEFVSLSCPLQRRARGLLVWFVLPPEAANAPMLNMSLALRGLIDPDSLRLRSRGRLYTDPGGNLNIANVSKQTDSFKYFCVDENVVVGYVKLIVRDSSTENAVVHYTDQLLATVSIMAPVVMITSVVALAVVAASPLYEPPAPW